MQKFSQLNNIKKLIPKNLFNELIQNYWGEEALAIIEGLVGDGGFDELEFISSPEKNDPDDPDDQDYSHFHSKEYFNSLSKTTIDILKNIPSKIIVTWYYITSFRYKKININLKTFYNLYLKNKNFKKTIDAIDVPSKYQKIPFFDIISIEDSEVPSKYVENLDDKMENAWFILSNYMDNFYNYPQGLANSDKPAKSSHELIIADLFYIIGLNFTEQINIKNWPNSRCYARGPIVDFLVEGSYFEVFGIHGEGTSINNKGCDYQDRKKEKIKNINPLFWIEAPQQMPSPRQRSLLLYAKLLSENTKSNIGSNPFQNTVENLKQKAPLLKTTGLNICKSYIEILKYNKNPYNEMTFNFLLKNAQYQISLEQIQQELSQEYQSSNLWSPEEQIAVYFKTPENLMAHMPQQQIYKLPDQNLQRAARRNNWYKKFS